MLMFLVVLLVLMSGFPVAFCLAGVGLLFALAGTLTGQFDLGLMNAFPNRLYGIMTNQTLLAVPLFVLMGNTLEKSGMAEQLLDSMARLFGRLRGGLGFSVTLVGVLLAASTGIVGATVVTMGLLSLPLMLRRGYDPGLASGAICATATLGQIIPPSIALVLLGDVISSAYQLSQLNSGVFSPDTVSVGDLFMGALIPGLIMALGYLVYLAAIARWRPSASPSLYADGEPVPAMGHRVRNAASSLLPPLLLIMAVLGSILAGITTPTEAAGIGATGAMLLATLRRRLTLEILRDIMDSTLLVTCMVFAILIGATLFSLVFRGLGGDDQVQALFEAMPGGVAGAILVVMLVIFLLGFILDFFEIIFVVVPIIGPILLGMGIDPVWLGVMIAINLQTSFMTPPFGFSLFYLRGVAPASVSTMAIYRGVRPFILVQLLVLGLVALFPQLATWLPSQIYG